MGNLYSFKLGDSIAEEEAEEEGGAEGGGRRAKAGAKKLSVKGHSRNSIVLSALGICLIIWRMYLSVTPTVYSSVCLSVCPSVCPSVCMFDIRAQHL